MATTQKEKNGTWTGRARIANQLSESKSGFRTKTDAKEWARKREKAVRERHRPRGKGPTRTPLAEALAIDAMKTLPFKKGAVAEANRINVYLRLAGLPTLQVVRCASASELPGSGRRKTLLKYYDVVEVPAGAPQQVALSLKGCRDALECAAEHSRRIQKRLAHTPVADISSADLDDLVKARQGEGKSASTVHKDVHIIRSAINRLRRSMNWRSELRPITQHDVDLPALPQGRDRVLLAKEEKVLVAALSTSYHPKALPAVAFLVESAMRFTEAMDTACWGHVLWPERELKLVDAKGGARVVPLSEGALAVLRAMPRGADHEPIFGISYESLKAIFRRACERAGIDDLRLHDLRHTGTTRAAKRLNGNIFLLKILSGHKTLSQLERYVNPTAQDVVEAFRATEHLTCAAPAVKAACARAGGVPKSDEPRRIAQPRYQGDNMSGNRGGGAVVIALPIGNGLQPGAYQPASISFKLGDGMKGGSA
jgi:integrase